MDSPAPQPDVRYPERAAARRYWQKAKQALFDGRISAGAFALLQRYEQWIKLRGDDDHSLSISERKAAPEARIVPNTYRKYRRLLEGAELLECKRDRKEGFCWYPRLRMTGLFLNGQPAAKSAADTAAKSAADTAAKSAAPSLPLRGKAPPPSEALKACPAGKVIAGPEGKEGNNSFPAQQQARRPGANPHGKASSVDSPDRNGEIARMAQLRKLLGNETMKRDGGKWRLRCRNNRGKVDRVIAELRTKLAEGHKIRSRAGYLESLWKLFR